jgi:hypothetical protein
LNPSSAGLTEGPPPPAAPAGQPLIELEIGRGVWLRISGAVDPDLAATVTKALRGDEGVAGAATNDAHQRSALQTDGKSPALDCGLKGSASISMLDAFLNE